MDTRIFLDINRFARHTAFAHGVMTSLAGVIGLVILAALLLAGSLEGRRNRARPLVGTAGWTLLVAAATLGLGEALGHALGRATPAHRLHGIEVLYGGASGFSLPDLHTALAAALFVAMLAAGARLVGVLAVVVALLIAFAGVYVGAHFPLDEVAGIALGAVVALLATPLLRRELTVGETRHTVSLANELAGFGQHVGQPQSGPAAQPVPLAATGAVRVLPVTEDSGDAGVPDGPRPGPRLRAASSVTSAAAAAAAAAAKPTSPTPTNSQRQRPVTAVAPPPPVTIPAPEVDPAGERRGPVTILPRRGKPTE